MEYKSLELFSSGNLSSQKKVLLKLNQQTSRYGLSLSEKDITELVTKHTETLKKARRIDFAGEILPKLIYAFCDSPYISDDEYLDTLIELTELFYHYKNECMEILSDDELVGFMADKFNSNCLGNLRNLADTLEEYCHSIRYGDSSGDNDGDYLEEDDYE